MNYVNYKEDFCLFKFFYKIKFLDKSSKIYGQQRLKE